VSLAHEFEIAMALVDPAAVSHWSAMSCHRLTEPPPRPGGPWLACVENRPILRDYRVGKLTTMRWAKMMKVSHDTAQRDIAALIGHGILVKDAAGGRSTSYSLKPAARN
jgi:hypothetical protein